MFQFQISTQVGFPTVFFCIFVAKSYFYLLAKKTLCQVTQEGASARKWRREEAGGVIPTSVSLTVHTTTLCGAGPAQ